MTYTRPGIVSGVTKLTKPFFDNLLDGLDERLTTEDANATYAPLGLSRMAVATYALMLAVTPDANAVTRVKVANDENKGIAHTIYEVWPDGARIWLATTTEG